MATIGDRANGTHLPSHAVMAKADLPSGETWRVCIGRAISRCFALAGLSQKEAAGLLDRDAHQVARWINGNERPQLDTLFAVEQLRQPLVIALAELAGPGVSVETTITVTKVA